MSKFGSSQSVARREDARFLTGQGRYIDDIAPKGALRAVMLRSPVAHGTITTLDISDATEAPGVHLIVTARDLAEAGLANAMRFSRAKSPGGQITQAPDRPILADGIVRFVGEPVAFVVADTLAQARDAAELIQLDIDDLPVKTDLGPGGVALHAVTPDNVAYEWTQGDADATQEALNSAVHRVSLTTYDNRIIVNSLEPRGCYAELEEGRLHVALNGQGVWAPKTDIAKWLGLPREEVRVTNPDVGGGFGMKAMGYPEHFLCALATRRTGHAVHWMAERTESMLSDNAGRDLSVTCEMGFDADHRLVAYRVESLSNMGAYPSQFAQNIQSSLFSKVLPGTYDIGCMHFRNRGIYTNTTQVDAYRGAGRPEAIYALERTIDFAARQLGVDPMALRRRNFIQPAQMPYTTLVGETYDVGDFPRVSARAEREADLAGFAERRRAAEARGKLLGLGTCYYIEAILGAADETAEIVLTEVGAKLFVGTQSNGQGHETVYAQLLHDQTGLPLDAIEIVQGDSDQIATGGGTGGSRSVTVQGMALRETGDSLLAGLTGFLASSEGAEMAFDPAEGVFRAPGSNTVITLLEAADRARRNGHEALTRARKTVTLPGRSYPNGCHIAEVEIDRATGQTNVVRYTVVDDFGVLMNPMLAEGQVHGGVAQGIGQAITEHTVYDADGQLLTATFMDYAMPRAEDMPLIAFHSEPVPSVNNPLGMKGCGEAGTVGALAAVANAVQDALWPLGIRSVDMPFTPSRVWEMLQQEVSAVAAE